MPHAAEPQNASRHEKESLRVVFNSPQSGYMSLALYAGALSYSTVVSCRPYDSLADLIAALVALLRGDARRVVRWNCEPDELEFEFTDVASERLRFVVRHFGPHDLLSGNERTIFAVEGEKRAVCAAFHEALAALERDREEDAFARNWRREFPAAALRELTEALQAFAPSRGVG